MLQVRSSLDVADNTGAKVAWNIGVLGRNQRYARVGDVIKVTRVLTARSAVILEGTDERSKETEDKKRLVKPTLHYVRKNAQNPEGRLLWLEGPIHVSNVMKAADFEARKTRKATK